MQRPFDPRHLHTLSRRDVLRAGSLGLFGLGLGELLRGRASAEATDVLSRRSTTFGRAKSCILLFMWGGPAHQDTWDLKPAAPAEIRGEFQPISTRVPGIQICEHFPQLAERTDRLAIVRSMTHTDVDHLTSTHYLLTGQPPPKAPELRGDWPHVGRRAGATGAGSRPAAPVRVATPQAR